MRKVRKKTYLYYEKKRKKKRLTRNVLTIKNKTSH